MQHLTLNTGHSRESSISEVQSFGFFIPFLRVLIEGKTRHPFPMPELFGYEAQAVEENDSLAISVFYQGTPQATFITFRGPILLPSSWESLLILANSTASLPICPPQWKRAFQEAKCPDTTPCCVVLLHPAIRKDAAEWLGDFERCMAWAWISMELKAV